MFLPDAFAHEIGLEVLDSIHTVAFVPCSIPLKTFRLGIVGMNTLNPASKLVRGEAFNG